TCNLRVLLIIDPFSGIYYRMKGKVVFTSATSPGKNAALRDQAAFLEEHSNPEQYAKAFESMQPQVQINQDKWGKILAVLVPWCCCAPRCATSMVIRAPCSKITGLSSRIKPACTCSDFAPPPVAWAN
ncbi:MAG: hypothetical protein Q7U74_11945, partial [Saprospiraceae bacterium]|nr:hypothetical protein [Saprospiraceae bacterium]